MSTLELGKGTLRFIRLCSSCGALHGRPYRSQCLACHNASSRAWKKANPLTGDAYERSMARLAARSAERSGKLVRQPCENCGEKNSQKHHADYTKPLAVTWLCRSCHLMVHAQRVAA